MKGTMVRSFPGDDMYGYYIMLGQGHGDGPGRVDPLGAYEEWRMPDNYHIEYAFHKYSQNGWVTPATWLGPQSISRGAPEAGQQQGYIYVGPPAGLPEPVVTMYDMPRLEVGVPPAEEDPVAGPAPDLVDGSIAPASAPAPFLVKALSIAPSLFRHVVGTAPPPMGVFVEPIFQDRALRFRNLLDEYLLGRDRNTFGHGREIALNVDLLTWQIHFRHIPDRNQRIQAAINGDPGFDTTRGLTPEDVLSQGEIPNASHIEPLPEAGPPPQPQPMTHIPEDPESLILQNQEVFEPHIDRVVSFFHSRLGADIEVDSECIITQDMLLAVRQEVNPSGMLLHRSDEPVRLPSPGPLRSIYSPPGSHPHPRNPFNPSRGRSPLANIHQVPTFINGGLAPVPGICASCGAHTCGTCESDEHHPRDRCYVCGDCDAKSRAKIWDYMEGLHLFTKMRRMACKGCTEFIMTHAQAPDYYRHSGQVMYHAGLSEGVPAPFDPRIQTNNFWPGEGLVVRGGIFPIYPYTGFSCAEKLLGRRLCGAHRAQGFLDVVERVYQLGAFLMTRYDWPDTDYSRACPSCLVNSPLHPDDPASPYAGNLFFCLSCSGMVIEIHPSMLPSANYVPYPEVPPGAEGVVWVPGTAHDDGADAGGDGGAGGADIDMLDIFNHGAGDAGGAGGIDDDPFGIYN